MTVMKKYPFGEIEKKWQAWWRDNQTFKVSEDPAYPKEKRRYVLDMFPYPSSDGLHVGHPEGYTATDIYCRYSRMNGYNVLHPMGFDSFGLPAENYAIETGAHPAASTEKNQTRFREQIKSFGFSYDWSREISTSDTSYYKWTQWIFLQIFKKNLAYEAEAPINWCPSCKTGLANEEVKEGKCERCRALVFRKNIRQWLLKITDYAEDLLAGLDQLDWPDSIKTMQRNWIGRSEGANVYFDLDGHSGQLEVFTTRPDTLFGATYMVLAPEHPLIGQITGKECRREVEKYLQQAAAKSDLERTDLAKEKTGVFSGAYAINPVNDQKIPIWIADYVLISYGSGAIMAVPGHDERDWEFAKIFGLPIVEVLAGGDIQKAAFTGDGPHVNSGFLDSLNKQEAIAAVIDFLEKKAAGRRAINYRLRDWLFSRQRYWGEPIPLIHCPVCGITPLPEKDLPLTLPEVKDYKPTGEGESPLAALKEWVSASCPQCGAAAKRETNTMPQWAGSCWYYMRYLDPANDDQFAAPEKLAYWMPVDLYVGGAEHAVLHLLYARFWHRVLYDLGVVREAEPFKRLVNQGMITSFAYQREDKTLVTTDKVEEVDPGVFVEKATGKAVAQVIAKMSKSLKNVINPDEVIRDYGADSVRAYEMFMGPLRVSKPWSTNGLIGVHRFLEKVWRCSEKPLSRRKAPVALNKLLHKTIKKVSLDTEALAFNTAISQMMIFINEVYKEAELYPELWSPFVLMLSVYAPHIGEELWQKLGNAPSVSRQKWPVWQEEWVKDAETTVVVQINGKLRAKFIVQVGADKKALQQEAFALDKVKERLQGQKVVKTIVVPDKLVNIVVRPE